MITIPLTQGLSAVVDDVDADLASLKWSTLRRRRKCYAHRKNRQNKNVTLHQMIAARMRLPEPVSFVNGNSLDCRRENLTHFERDVMTFRRSKRNDNTSGQTGVYYCKQTDMWRVHIHRDGERIEYGRYPTFEEAAEVRKEAEREVYGETR